MGGMIVGCESVQGSRYTRYFMALVDVLTLCLSFHMCSIVLRAWEASRDALGDAWGIIEGQLGDLRSILDESRERMTACDVM